MRALSTFVVLALLALGLVSSASAKEPAAGEAQKHRTQVAVALVDYAGWCAKQGAKAAGEAALAEAEGLDSAAPKLAETRADVEALAEDAPTAADAVAKQRKVAGPKIAKLYDKLVSLEHDPKEAVQYEDYAFRALAWDFGKPRLAKLQKSVEDAADDAKRVEQAGRVLARLERADPDGAAAGRYEKVQISLAQKDLIVIGSPKHPLVGYLSLPKDWAKGKTYPVIVGVEGAGCNFAGYARGLAASRGSRPVIVLTPVSLTSTNALDAAKFASYGKACLDEWDKKRIEFDGPGIDALLEVVRARFGGEEKVFLTGFSGGGIYTYWKLFQDPSHVRGAAPACGNFGGTGLQGAPGAGADGGPPVHLFTGEKDEHRDHVFGQKPGIEGQTDLAEENLKKLGYTHVTRTMVKGAGHSSLHAMVWRFVDEVLGK